MPDVADERLAAGAALSRFPGYAEVVLRLIGESEIFRSLCEDHTLAVEALAKFEAERRPEDRLKVKEYRDLVAELEQDMAVQIDRAASTLPAKRVG